jgi:molybdopterin-containing oxidoreductase family iron-sulfur binding subunit
MKEKYISESGGKKPFDFAAIQAKLEKEGGRRFWQSLEELAETPAYRDSLDHEFPHAAEKNGQEIHRRDVLKLMAASAALAGLSACTKLPTQKIVPYVRAPEEIIPGKPLFYATSMPQAGIAAGLLVESHMGRPTKIEGNPQHPGSLGGTDVFAQASVLDLYDPDRSQVVIHEGRISDWSAFLAALNVTREELRLRKGAGLRFLTETITSPSLADQLRATMAAFPEAKWHQFEPCGRDAAREGARLAFGHYVNTVYRIGQADVIVSLDADFLCSGPGHVRHARDFSKRRIVEGPSSQMNRLYVVESTPSNTGAMADHRLPMRASEVESFASALAVRLGVAAGAARASATRAPNDWIAALARDLERHRGACLIVVGEEQPPAVHALAHAMNAALGNVGKTVIYTEPLEANPVNEMESLRTLTAEIDAGQVDCLVIVGANPAYNAPLDFDFARQLLKVKQRVHMGLYVDETAELCHWHIPETHYLEAWGDARAYDGTLSTIQPLIAPLYQGKSAGELFAAFAGHPERSSHDIVHDYWKAQHPGKDFEAFWETSLHDGVMAGTALPSIAVSLQADFAKREPGIVLQEGAIELVFRPDPAIGDGRFANNGWLQELPKPLTKLTWDNAAMVSPATAQRLQVGNGDVVKLKVEEGEVRAPIWVMPGQPDNSVTLHLGYGRRRAGHLGTGIGVNAYALRTSRQPWAASTQIEKTGEHYWLAATQHHNIIETGDRRAEEESVAAFRRDLIRVATLDEFRNDPGFAQAPERGAKELSLYPDRPYEGYAWGMAIDLNRCIGCNACVVACQAENNIPVVGKDQVLAGREMHWIRVDTYFRGGLEYPETYLEPVLCMHCENAPCEGVCPVGATVHSPEGLNEMVYNRCVGTRYCSNNCPYKVRRFNFKLYSDWTTPSLYGLRNPNVTVRSRGVMEKCTYCVQRINAAKIEAEKADRSVRDGEIVTACQGACPAEAIVFGDIHDPQSRVSKLKAQSRNYGLLEDLNTRPRTTYLAHVRNPNPEIHG